MKRWLLLAAGTSTRSLTDAQLIDAANRARYHGDHFAASVFLAVLAERVS